MFITKNSILCLLSTARTTSRYTSKQPTAIVTWNDRAIPSIYKLLHITSYAHFSSTSSTLFPKATRPSPFPLFPNFQSPYFALFAITFWVLQSQLEVSQMFKNTYQSGFLSILYSIGSKPLQIWQKQIHNGHIKRITDQDIQSSVLEIMGTNVTTALITCPQNANETLGIKLPFLVMIIKNLKKYFTFQVQVLDDKNVRRRFRASNYQSTTRVKPFICTMPMRLDEGWNQIQFNLSDFTRRAYGSNYIETLRVTIHANCRIRRIYFSDRLYSEEELPPEFKLFLPIQKQQ